MRDAKFIEGGQEAIKVIKESGSSFWVVSTSYHQYVWHTAPLAGISVENTRCTIFPIEDLKLNVTEEDREMVKEMADKIIETGDLKIGTLHSEEGLPPKVYEAITMMDRFFLETLPNSSFGYVLQNVKPVGGMRKLEALQEILRGENRNMEEVVVIGDSITDRNMLRETRENGGLAISFNGNLFSIDNANVAVVSSNCMITPVLVQVFDRAGIDGIRRITIDWSMDKLRQEVYNGYLDQQLFKRVSEIQTTAPPIAYWLTEENKGFVLAESLKSRAQVRATVSGLP